MPGNRGEKKLFNIYLFFFFSLSVYQLPQHTTEINFEFFLAPISSCPFAQTLLVPLPLPSIFSGDFFRVAIPFFFNFFFFFFEKLESPSSYLLTFHLPNRGETDSQPVHR